MKENTNDMRRSLTDAVRFDGEYAQLLSAIKQTRNSKPKPIMVSGLCEGATDILCTALVEDMPSACPALIICAEEKDCARMNSVLASFGIRAAVYPARDLNFYNVAASHEFEHRRIATLMGIIGGETEAVICTPDAALSYTIPPEDLRDSVLSVSASDKVEIANIASKLAAAGYCRASLAEGAGQFAVRGGILDVCFSVPTPGETTKNENEILQAVRIEFFGDEIDRMGLYDVSTQRVISNVDKVVIPPARELLPSREVLRKIASAISELKKKTKDPKIEEQLEGELDAARAAAENGGELKFIDKYISAVYKRKTCLLDYFSPMSICIVRGNAAVAERAKAHEWHMQRETEDMVASGTVGGKYADYGEAASRLDVFRATHTTVLLDSLMQGTSSLSLGGLFGFRTKHSLSCSENDELLRDELTQFSKSKYRTLLMATSETQAKNYTGLLNEWGIPAQFCGEAANVDLSNMRGGEVHVISDAVCAPFEMLSPRIAVVSLAHKSAITRERRERNKRRSQSSNTVRLLSYADLSEGDYVVHENHGIGIFEGISTMTVGGVTRDYITIRYAGSDKLFLPVEQLDKVSKYIGAHSDDGTLKLSKFGGTEWGRTKARTKAALKDVAKELIALYAERLRRPGHAFPADDAFQRDFEAAFEYDETAAQLDAITDIKEDMQKSTPMDRLLCGDVGYGKTEVAFRAIYKAILDGKQAALLVPTTILALQHYQTAVARMRAFPVNVEMLSRFRTPKEQKKIISDLEKGDVDLIIGTHRMLSSDIKFKSLGLLVIDEEQRFGVAQKEKIKQKIGNVDVLSLSATPIPRTLNMAMSGIRDISLLDEAPTDRLPVQTYVLEHDDVIIIDAIKRELRRGGQVFYLYNVVETIDHVAAKISAAIPEARVVTAHGKTDKARLEEIWQEMTDGEIDVLVSTTIIETGVDVPNANTLIVENAHKMGLSQLHQLRGRVGRSSRRAYAYFTFPRGRALSEISQKRLEAIREYAEFGAGFQIALRDLEIRGAGNVLGTEQHGHLDEVGYDLYIKLLNEAILEERGETPEEKEECTVTLDTDAFLPDTYVASSAQRMALYKKISHVRDENDVNELYDELCDRYGEPPAPALYLLDVSLLRARATACGITAVTQDKDEIRIHPKELDVDVWSELASEAKGKLRVVLANEPYLTLRLRRGEDAIEQTSELFKKYAHVSSQNK